MHMLFKYNIKYNMKCYTSENYTIRMVLRQSHRSYELLRDMFNFVVVLPGRCYYYN